MSKFAPGSVILDRYEIKRALGQGGMGAVYLAHDKRTNQPVALKVILAKYQGNAKAVARFVREVKTVRQLDHPYIVKILGARKDGDLLFYTMEYVQGRSLREYMEKKGRIRFGSVVRVLCMVAEALEHAHRITIHRDISPENIMVLRDGTVRLLDFGLAKLETGGTALTQIGASLGKLLYIAPEQRINAADVDLRADIYPMGVLLFEMLTGELPTGGKTIAALCPEAPSGCDAIYEMAAAGDPGARYPTARAFRDALLGLYNQTQEAEAKKAAGPPPPRKGPEKPSILARITKAFKRLFP